MSSSTSEKTTDPAPIEAPSVEVDPGQIIRINARFPDSPEAVLFSFLPPKSNVAVHDPGVGAVGSLVQRDGDMYHYIIDTRMMHGGLGWWYFVSEDADPAKRRAKVGKFTVRDVPRALLERSSTPTWQEPVKDDGLSLLGADVQNSGNPTVVLVGIGLTLGLAFALL